LIPAALEAGERKSFVFFRGGLFSCPFRFWEISLKVHVKLFGIFGDFFPPGVKGPAFCLEVEKEAGIKEVISQLKIPQDFPRSIVLNGRVAKEDQPLKEGDVIAFFTPITGG